MIDFDVNIQYIIPDLKTSKEMKKKTISNYRKNEVIKEFHNSIINSNVEESCKWFVEMHTSEYVNEIWNELIFIYSKNININNFVLLELLVLKNKYYQNYIKYIDPKFKIHLRNNQEIRNLFTNLVLRSTLSIKNDLFDNRTIPTIKDHDYTREGIVKNIKNDNLNLIIDIIEDEDSKELKIAINEIAYHMVSTKSLNNCIFWYLWLYKLAIKKKRDDIELTTKDRNIKNINKKYNSDWIWIIWKLIFKITNNINNYDLSKNIKYLYDLYKIDYKSSSKLKKQYLLYLSFYSITSMPNFKSNKITKENLLIQASLNINYIYYMLYYNLKKDPEIEVDKKTYLNNIIQEMSEIEEKNKKKKISKNRIKDNKELKEEYTTTNRLSYLNDLLFFKNKDKNRHIPKISNYFKNNNDKKFINL